MFIQTRAPSVIILAPGALALFVTLMRAETPSSVLLASSGYTCTAPPSPVLTFTQAVQLALQWVGVSRRAALKVELTPLPRPILSLPRLRPLLPPSPRVPPTTTWLLSTAATSGPPRYPCSLCSHEVGKVSLKCSTCSKWAHFSCSSLTQAHFRKICAAGSTMGWNCPVFLKGDLSHPPASLPLPVPPPPPPPTNMFTCSEFISTPTFTPSPF